MAFALPQPDLALRYGFSMDEPDLTFPFSSPKYLLPSDFLYPSDADFTPSAAFPPSDDIFFPPQPPAPSSFSNASYPLVSSAPLSSFAGDARFGQLQTAFADAFPINLSLSSGPPPPTSFDDRSPPLSFASSSAVASNHSGSLVSSPEPIAQLSHQPQQASPELRPRRPRTSSLDSEETMYEEQSEGDGDDFEFKVASSSADEGHIVGSRSGPAGSKSSRSKSLKGTTLRDVLEEANLTRSEYEKMTPAQKRTLRNKSSARAFRARKKTFVHDLEGKLAEKESAIEALQAELKSLRATNRALEARISTASASKKL